MPVTRESDVQCPIGENVLLFQRMTGVERLGRPFEFHLELRSDNTELKLNDVLGQPMTVRMDTEGGNSRYFNGFTSEFSFVGMAGRQALYTATLRPWLWFLTRAQDCRIFQDKTAPDIIQEVFQAHNFSDVESMLNGEYKQLGYCVQYRETDFDFVTRLMEQEGIYYYFRHEEGKHTLVLADGLNSHELIEDFETTLYYPPDANERREKDHVSAWMMTQQAHTSTYALRDYDFTKPRAGLDVKATVDRGHDLSGFEQFDYPGLYTQIPDGEQYVETRIQEVQTDYERALAGGSVRGLFAGGLTELTNHPREDQNKEYLIESVEHELVGNLLESGSGADGGTPGYKCKFTAIDSQQRYRLPRSTQKPFVQGPQTAVVTGPEGEKIWPDEYGRVKVKFHWDRHGKSDATSSCWVRVSQNWAGKGWGGMFIPHVGHEVIVDFLEGDPDQPIITGRVYNGENKPAEKLPDNMHKSYIRDHYGNELVFDGTPGDEHIELQSPHHESSLHIGRSVKYTTDSDYDNWTYGNSTGGTLGSKAEFNIGATAGATLGVGVSLFAGAQLDVWIGASLGITLGYKYECNVTKTFTYNNGATYTWNKAKDYEFGEADWTKHSEGNVTLDSEQKFLVIGGDHDNSFIELDDGGITLSHGEGDAQDIKAEADFLRVARKKGAQGVAAGLVGAAALVGTGMLIQSQGKTVEGTDDWKEANAGLTEAKADPMLKSQEECNQDVIDKKKKADDKRDEMEKPHGSRSLVRQGEAQKANASNEQERKDAEERLEKWRADLKLDEEELEKLENEVKYAEIAANNWTAHQHQQATSRLAAAQKKVDDLGKQVESRKDPFSGTLKGCGIGFGVAAGTALTVWMAYAAYTKWGAKKSPAVPAPPAAQGPPKEPDEKDPPSHADPNGKIDINEQGVLLANGSLNTANCLLEIMNKDKGWIYVGADKSLDASLTLKAKQKTARINGSKKIALESAELELKTKKITHKNFTVVP